MLQSVAASPVAVVPGPSATRNAALQRLWSCVETREGTKDHF